MIIAITAPAMGSGKSTIAQYLVDNHGFTLVKLAGPLKNMTRTFLAELGYDEEEIEALVEGHLKNVGLPEIGVTTRHIMQTLGAEWGRECISKELWLDITRHRLRGLKGQNAVIDDVRYHNELAMLEGMGAHAWRIVRPSAQVERGHSSEGDLDHLPMVEIMNDGSIPALQERVEQALAGVGHPTSKSHQRAAAVLTALEPVVPRQNSQVE